MRNSSFAGRPGFNEDTLAMVLPIEMAAFPVLLSIEKAAISIEIRSEMTNFIVKDARFCIEHV